MKQLSKLIVLLPAVLFLLPCRSQQSVTLLFAGDAMQHQAQLESAKNAEGYNYVPCFEKVKKEIASCDLSIVNLETPLGGEPYLGYPRFSAPDSYAQALKEAGFDLFLTANNHCLDQLTRGLLRTIDQLDSLKVKHLGTYRTPEEREQLHPLMLIRNDIRFAFLNYTYGTNGFTVAPPATVNYINYDQIKKDISRAKEAGAEILVACIHWGEEYQLFPEKTQKALADTLINQGVQLIVGAHPHVVQPMEMITDSCGNHRAVIAYSLGNFISNMKISHTTGGALLKVKIRKENFNVFIESSEYALVFTQRPVHGNGNRFILLPASRSLSEESETTPATRPPLRSFVEETRKFFDKYNKGITEYIF